MRSQRAFTLVELLVVIGIIAVLVGILLPVLGRARAQANSVWCLSNIRQFGLAFQMYAQANKGVLPVYYFQPAPPATGGTDWAFLILPYLKPSAGGTYADGDPSSMWRLYRDKDTVDTEDNPSVGYKADQRQTYSVVTAFFGGNTPSTLSPSRLKPYKFSSIRRSSEMMLLGDAAEIGNVFGVPGTFATTANYYALQSGSTSYCHQWATPALAAQQFPKGPDAGLNRDWLSFTDMQGATGANGSTGNQLRFRHVGNTQMNALFADGHAASFRYRKPGLGGSELKFKNIIPDDFNPAR